MSFKTSIQTLPGHRPVQPALGDPALAGGLDYMISRCPFQPLPFCESSGILMGCSLEKLCEKPPSVSY